MESFPIRNASYTGNGILSHSGEFTNQVTDVVIPGRGLSFRMVRTYRSSKSNDVGLLGRGWCFNYDRRLTKEGRNICYYDGEGRKFLFMASGRGFTTPPGLYCQLRREGNTLVQDFRYGTKQIFQLPEDGGQMIQIVDRNLNRLFFQYRKNKLTIVDTFNRNMHLHLSKGKIDKVEDFTGRKWEYVYDQFDRLTEVIRPATKDHPDGTRIRYTYDDKNRLNSIRNGRGQLLLENLYTEKQGRVSRQKFGNSTFELIYEAITESKVKARRTTTTRNETAVTVQDHNSYGHEIKHATYVYKAHLQKSDRKSGNEITQAIITRHTYNSNGEITSKIYPKGNKTINIYDESNNDVKSQGNLLKIQQVPSKRTGKALVSTFEYESKYQFIIRETDARGNSKKYNYDEWGNLILVTILNVDLYNKSAGDKDAQIKVRLTDMTESFVYNKGGQLLRHTHYNGIVDEYTYWPINDPYGTTTNTSSSNGINLEGREGLVSKVTKDTATMKSPFLMGYDVWGNVKFITDPKGNTTTRVYNAMGFVEEIISCEPFRYKVLFSYDQDYNQIKESKTFTFNQLSHDTQSILKTQSVFHIVQNFNSRNSITERKFVSHDKTISERFIRDNDDNIIALVQPLGNKSQYKYDQLNRLIYKNIDSQNKDAKGIHYQYSLNGELGSMIDANDNESIYEFDLYGRQSVYINAVGTREQRYFDENNNLVKTQIYGYLGDSINKKANQKHVLLDELIYHYDRLNRPYKVDKKWFIPGKTKTKENNNNSHGSSIGTVIEYGFNGFVENIWDDRNGSFSFKYDGLNRIIESRDSNLITSLVHYDKCSNVSKLQKRTPEGSIVQTINIAYDELNRIVNYQENDDASTRYSYNSLNTPITNLLPSGIELNVIQDSLGRVLGSYYEVGQSNSASQKVIRLREFSDNYQVISSKNANDQKVMYVYNDWGGLSRVVLPDGNTWNYYYDRNLYLERISQPDKSSINHAYDAIGRLTHRSYESPTGKILRNERFTYDGKNQLTSIIDGLSTLKYTYDSLFQVTQEQQDKHKVTYQYNKAGNVKKITYPGGYSSNYEYDERGRCKIVLDNNGEALTEYSYNSYNEIESILFGKSNSIQALIKYDNSRRLSTLEYKWINKKGKKHHEGTAYRYDRSGNMLCEMKLGHKPVKGDYYFYDHSNRLEKAQYGKKDLNSLDSGYDYESKWTFHPSGAWKRQLDTDSRGNVIDDKVSTLTSLNNYKTFGKYVFKYNDLGLCVFQGEITPNKSGRNLSGRKLPIIIGWEYEYDEKARLKKASLMDSKGKVFIAIEYEYDGLDRLIKRTVTDANGKQTIYTYVWNGNQLAQEYKDGKLVKEYVYGIQGGLPTRIRILGPSGALKEIEMLFNGRGFAEIFVDRITGEILQRLTTNAHGHTLPAEINGQVIPQALRQTRLNQIFSSFIKSMNGFASVPTPIDILNQHQSGKTNRFNNKMQSIFGHSPATIQDYLTGNTIFGGSRGNSLINSIYHANRSPYFPFGPKTGLSSQNSTESSLKEAENIFTVIGAGLALGSFPVAGAFAAGVSLGLAARNMDENDVVAYIAQQNRLSIWVLLSLYNSKRSVSNSMPEILPGGTAGPTDENPDAGVTSPGSPCAGTPDPAVNAPNSCNPGTSGYPKEEFGTGFSNLNWKTFQRIINSKIWGNRTPMDPRIGGFGIGGPINSSAVDSKIDCGDPLVYCDDMGLNTSAAGFPGWLKTDSHPLLNFCKWCDRPGGAIISVSGPNGGVIDPK